MKKVFIFLAAAVLSVSLLGCGQTKTFHCANCGKEVSVSVSSDVDEDWIVYCKDCEKELGLDTLVEERP